MAKSSKGQKLKGSKGQKVPKVKRSKDQGVKRSKGPEGILAKLKKIRGQANKQSDIITLELLVVAQIS